MRNVSHRFPFLPALFHHALALGLNGRHEEARIELVRFRKLHPPEHDDEPVENLHALACGGVRNCCESLRAEDGRNLRAGRSREVGPHGARCSSGGHRSPELPKSSPVCCTCARLSAVEPATWSPSPSIP